MTGQPIDSPPNEQGWKDTIVAFSGEVTVIRLRFTAQDGSKFPFDATTGPGNVWHCHIIEHEDNEMMHPYIVIRTTEQFPVWLLITLVIIVADSASILRVIGLRYLRQRSLQKKRETSASTSFAN